MSPRRASAIPANGAERDLKETSGDDIAACRAILREGSKSFHLAALLLPKRVRNPAAALYAFCRLADDAVDLEAGGRQALAALAERLDRVYGGHPAADPVERALAATVRDYALPRTVLDALIEGLAWDAEGRRYETIGDLRAYAARVASTVGVASTLLMGVRAKAALARAADLGVAMQLTNIARDVAEDARAGRLYLPLAWMRDAGIDPDRWLAEPVFDRRLAGVVARLLTAADELYRRAAGGIALLPVDCRPGIHAARLIYAEIGREIERGGVAGLSRRAVVSSGRKTCLLGSALLRPLISSARGSDLPPLAETQFLVDAVAARGPAAASFDGSRLVPWWNLEERIGRTIDLFARLQQEERLPPAEGRR